ncbi:Mth938-like domain-containing protein [Neoehrlichia mikurensis]|uniref:Mth938-like domain-containing protein n=1 Tax=Neoehrlichia mikurensis TaxID=89586 RepID=A0A9Q9F524_9RICK|nr:Mth938-like domain-containing protein [Neoehrlichia mikurensis]QXK91878.1 Mth938-like domain-containing protein [Neoehrlichia mikurensis]QXK93091.1 hypothetical protein HUN61_03940 [Neoehrlichia mikurensis]QXK93571.1 Mth938-like domain-containing protein [Neoehrlichia mikurensis]UTO55476.1 Mth938-like domain-containing protein [Neoehrlichia mikurensis]UTO56396.1 Mth938-like domain-containing protein [Neoehrlichia mikurensis]
MDITPVIPLNINLINSFSQGKFVIAGKVYYGSCVVFQNEVVLMQELNFANIGRVISSLDNSFQVILVGTGKECIFLPKELHDHFCSLGLNVEYMSTPAACRTYNVLLYDDRKVCTVLMAL